MTKIGKLYICDRCGNTGFAGYGGGIDRSGGIDPFGKFEKLEGWGIWEGRRLFRPPALLLKALWPTMELLPRPLMV